MGEELNWSKDEKAKQIKEATEFLASEMGQIVNRQSRDKIPINLSKDEIQLYIKRFQIIDKESKGYVSINDIRRALKVHFYVFFFFFFFLQWEIVYSFVSLSKDKYPTADKRTRIKPFPLNFQNK